MERDGDDPCQAKVGSRAILMKRLLRLDTPCLSDALDKLGLPGVIIGLVCQTVPGAKVAGCATTIRLGPPLPDPPQRHLGVGAIMAAEAGDIIVIEHGSDDISGWGGLLTRGALARGIAAVVIDGAYRDLDEARALGLPIFGRTAVPITARGRIAEHACNEVVTIRGVAVAPGDYVLADGSGAVFIDQNRVAEIVEVAEDIFDREQRMAADIDAGVPLNIVLGKVYETMLDEAEK